MPNDMNTEGAQAMKKAQKAEDKTDALDKEMIGVKHTLNTHSIMLEEIRESGEKTNDTLYQMNKVLQGYAIVHDFMETNKASIADIRSTIEKRREQSEVQHKEFSDFISRIKGGFVVLCLLLGLFQACFFWALNSNSQVLDRHEDRIRMLEIDNATHKAVTITRTPQEPAQGIKITP